ncbi:MAG: phosphoribosyltransferase family protein [Myxococcota bacterium]
MIELLAPERCAACDHSVEQAGFCASCAALVERASDARAVFEYEGPLADAIQRFKFEDRTELARPLGRRLAEEATRVAQGVDAVVPVPLHWRRRRSRGYDQAALLARPVARALGVPLWLRRLRRVRSTPRQVGLPRAARLRNLRGAFSCVPLRGSPSVLLVDDVATTGATLAAATQALRQAGAVEVVPLVLAVRLLR